MAVPKETNISTLYAELNRSAQTGEYEKALRSANKILHEQPDEDKAFHCKIVSLIQLSKFQDALQAISKFTKISSGLAFEKAYCQYRLNQVQDALKTINSISAPPLHVKELKAQILYRLEKYEECFEVYRDIIKNSQDEYEDERETNLSAVVASLCMDGSPKDFPEQREHSYELCYNAACMLIGKKQYTDAQKKLLQAEKLCREFLEEDGMPEEEIEEELGIIKVQLAYCHQMLGKEKDAQNIYNATLKQKPSDIGLVAVASNNSLAINRDQNVFDSKKKIRSATADGLDHKLTTAQRKKIAINQCLVSMYTNQKEQCRQQCENLKRHHPDTGVIVTLIQATQLARGGQVDEAEAMLNKFGKDHSSESLAMKLASVQLLLTEGKRPEAIKILENLGDITYSPGVVSALVVLYMADNNREGASKILKNAVEWYRKKKVSSGDLGMLWRQAADFHLRGGEPEVAARSLEELRKINPEDKKTLAQLVVAYALFDPKKAQALSKELPPCEVLSQAVDIDSLESSNWAMGAKYAKRAAKTEGSPGTPGEDLVQKKKKKKKKGKLPKNCDPNATPDPERWLPRHERSANVRKKYRRKDVGMKGTQGAATAASDMYDITKMAPQSKPTAQQSPVAESSGPRQQQRRAQQKKKKKGGKW